MKQKYLLALFVPVLVLLLIFIYPAFLQESYVENPRNEILLRKIGHELLNSSRDSISKVMPIKILSANEFQINFENEFSFVPDSLVTIVQRNIKKSTFPSEYSVNVFKCSNKEIIYSFLISLDNKENIIPCIGRSMPNNCYNIIIKFGSNENAFLNNKFIFFVIVILVLSALLWHLFNRKKEKITPKKESAKNIQIGKYIFYYEQHYVEYEGVKVLLTSKESKLLHIFFSSPNKIIERNILQKEVWTNEGIIVTRSLDMFVSKLRKKLDKDPLVNIINIHGIGYKLEVINY
ncbi:MAG: winged helix-turn-helix domain-containing protein [Flavobacterium sp.]